MKVKELIKQLKEYPNQEVDVYVWEERNGDLFEINLVDISIEDRVDLNIKI